MKIFLSILCFIIFIVYIIRAKLRRDKSIGVSILDILVNGPNEGMKGRDIIKEYHRKFGEKLKYVYFYALLSRMSNEGLVISTQYNDEFGVYLVFIITDKAKEYILNL